MSYEEHDIAQWVDEARDSKGREFRQAVHTTLAAIAADRGLRASMVLKGGILLAVRYASHRFTRDIDFSTPQLLEGQFTKDAVVSALDSSLSKMVETLGYDLDCRVQSSRINPNNPEATFPSIKVTIGYAYKGTEKHKRLLRSQSPDTVSIDYSFNELTPNIDILEIGGDEKLQVYSLTDVIAEKIRSLLQQVVRERNRRQDVYDLHFLLLLFSEIDQVEKKAILDSLIKKSASRGISVTKDSFDDPEIKSRARHEYESLRDEIEDDLPDFEESFGAVVDFYKGLPW